MNHLRILFKCGFGGRLRFCISDKRVGDASVAALSGRNLDDLYVSSRSIDHGLITCFFTGNQLKSIGVREMKAELL